MAACSDFFGFTTYILSSDRKFQKRLWHKHLRYVENVYSSVGGDSLQNMINAAIAIVISAAVTMVAMLVFGMKDVRKAEENEEETDTELDDLMEI